MFHSGIDKGGNHTPAPIGSTGFITTKKFGKKKFSNNYVNNSYNRAFSTPRSSIHQSMTSNFLGQKYTKPKLMSDLPETQDKKIVSILMKAYEHKEIKKLNEIQKYNSKILQRIKRVEEGKELSVGHHIIDRH